LTRVDVVIPIQGQADTVRTCLHSILAVPQTTPYEIVVVDDASPDPELRRMLGELADRKTISLLEQPAAQGFGAAVNRATRLHPDRDVVVLHDAAVVFNDWLDRLSTHAAGNRDVGTVTTFASSGGVAGYPRMEARNGIPDGSTASALDALFRRANARSSIAVPAGYGPCVYFRRACLESVGAFDDAFLDAAFGVEQDFALRALSAGFRHLLAGDVYVAYGGAVAGRGADGGETAARADSILRKHYPEYPVRRAEFLASDPARPFRRAVDLERLRESPRHLVCFIAHAWGGGIRRHMTDLAALIGQHCEVLLLEPATGDTVRLSWFRDGEDFTAYFALPGDMAALVSLLRALAVERLHFHHVHALPRSVLELPGAVGVPYDCTLHDYYAICPQYHLVTEKGDYCGEPDARGCAACLARRPGQWGLDITEWRAAFGTLLRAADRVIAPSRGVEQRIARYFPGLRVTVTPHPEPAPGATRRVVRVAVLGNLTPEKGLHAVVACARDAKARNLPLAFRVVGSTTLSIPQWPEAPLSIHGQYEESDLQALIEAERPDVIWFPAQVPETYSYTLSVAMLSEIPVVASALGALPERLAGRARSFLLPWDASAAQWNEALSAAGSATAAAVRPLPRIAIS
jgi:glycosyltransferase involved in cell wall biosynthesis/GT2 family glycosyltransferase